MYKFAKKAANHEGFTLVELIVVIAILGILAGIAIPVYSGYIKKANQAADNMLLSAVNTAIGAALAENGFAKLGIGTKLDVQEIDGKNYIKGVIPSNVTPDAELTLADLIAASFMTYFGENANVELKYCTSDANFDFHTDTQTFFIVGSGSSGASGWTSTPNGDGTSTWTNGILTITVNDADVASVQNSAFGHMGMTPLMNQVNVLSESGASIFNSRPDDLYTKMGPGFQSFVSDTLGKSAEDVQDMSSQDLMNAVILYTMDQSQDLNAESVMASVLDTSETGFAKTTMNGITAIARGNYEDAGATVSNVAMAYAMVLGYCSDNPDAVMKDGTTASEFITKYTNEIKAESGSGTRALFKVLNMLGEANQSESFQNYLKGESGDGSNSDGMTDLQGYIAAMRASGSNISNLDIPALLTNGVTDPDMLTMLNSIFG